MRIYNEGFEILLSAAGDALRVGFDKAGGEIANFTVQYETLIDGETVPIRRYDTAQACFAWVASGSNAQENSATRFQCFSDRLCYTQHPGSLDCGGALATDKEARTGLCLQEPAGRLYSMLQSGNEGCPAPPPGFACPLSAPGAGTR